MFDTATDHVDHVHVNHFPLCGIHNVRMAMNYLDEFSFRSGQYNEGDMRAAILKLQSAILKRW